MPNIGGALCSAPQSLADAAAGVLCSNAANIGKHQTWTQSELCSCQNSLRGQEPPQNVYIVYQTRRWLNIVQVWLASSERRPCSNEDKMRNPLKFAGVPQTTELISAVSRPTFAILW